MWWLWHGQETVFHKHFTTCVINPPLFRDVPWSLQWVMLDGSTQAEHSVVTSPHYYNHYGLRNYFCPLKKKSLWQKLAVAFPYGLRSKRLPSDSVDVYWPHFPPFLLFFRSFTEPILNFYLPFIPWIKKYRSLLNFLCHPHSGVMLISVLSVISAVHIAKVSTCYRILNIFLSL